MRDLDLTFRDQFGVVTFGIKQNSQNTGIETIIQKVATSILSTNKSTYFGNIYGSDTLNAGKYNFTDNGSDDYRVTISSDILNVKKQIQADEVKFNIPIVDRLKDLQIKDIVFDIKTHDIFLSLLISTNSSTQIIQLPVKS
jgi:hypothetical protein